MLLEIINQLQSDILEEIPSFKKVDRYKLEFEEGTDWSPEFPVCFIRYDGIKPLKETQLADGTYTRAYINLTLFVGDKDTEQPVVLGRVESVQSLFTNSSISITIDSVVHSFPCSLTEAGADIHGYVNGVEVYKVYISILIPYKLIDIIINPPAQVTLVSPANAALGIEKNNADLEWNAAADALTYEVLVSTAADFSTTIFRQAGWNYLKLTLPNDLLNISTAYYWKVRARGAGGDGAWSTARSFTTGSENVLLPMNPLQIGNCILRVRSDSGITLAGSKVSQWNDQSPSLFHLSNATDANRPSLVSNAYGDKSAVYYNPGAGIHCLGRADAAGLLKITAGISRSWMLTYLESDSGTGGNYLLGRGNTSNGVQYVPGKLADAAAGFRIGCFFYPRANFNSGNITIPEETSGLRQIILVNNLGTGYLYINGALASKRPITLDSPAIPDNVNTFLSLGSGYYNNPAAGTAKMHCFEFAFWNKALTQIEISELYLYHQEYFNL